MVCRSSFVVTPITPGRTCLSLVCVGKMLGKHKNCSSVKLSRSCLSERESRSRLVVCSAGAGGGARGHRWGGTAAGRAVIGAPVPCAPLSPAPRGERTVSPAREQLAGALKCTCWRAFFRGGGGGGSRAELPGPAGEGGGVPAAGPAAAGRCTAAPQAPLLPPRVRELKCESGAAAGAEDTAGPGGGRGGVNLGKARRDPLPRLGGCLGAGRCSAGLPAAARRGEAAWPCRSLLTREQNVTSGVETRT